MAASKKPIKPLKSARRHPIQLAEIAYRELDMPGTLHSQADQARLGRLWRGLQFLDELLAAWKGSVDRLVEQYELTGDPKPLIAGIKELNIPRNLKEYDEYQKELVKIPWGDAMTMISDRMEDIEDFDEVKLTALLELLIDKPVKLTTPNPRKR